MITLYFMMFFSPPPTPPTEYWAHEGPCWYQCRKATWDPPGIATCDLGCAAKPKEMP